MSENFVGEPPVSRGRQFASAVIEIVKVLVIAVLIMAPVRYFLVHPFYVKGASMEPNFYDHEYLIIDELSYRFHEPQRGEIVVFKYPRDIKQYYIKRIIGLPGERVVVRDGRVWVARDGGEPTALTESYLDPAVTTEEALRGYSDITLGSDEYFLLGDNRDQSFDSRSFGAVKRDFLIGRTWVRGWPLDRMTVFDVPTYNL